MCTSNHKVALRSLTVLSSSSVNLVTLFRTFLMDNVSYFKIFPLIEWMATYRNGNIVFCRKNPSARSAE